MGWWADTDAIPADEYWRITRVSDTVFEMLYAENDEEVSCWDIDVLSLQRTQPNEYEPVAGNPTGSFTLMFSEGSEDTIRVTIDYTEEDPWTTTLTPAEERSFTPECP